MSTLQVLAQQKDSTKRHPKIQIGWLERVRIGKGEVTVQAEMNPGRLTSLLHAEEVKRSEKGKGDIVHFLVRDRFGHEERIKAPFLREINLKSSSGSTRSLPVAQLGLCLAGKYIEDEVAISDQGSSEHEMVLGRQTLEGNFVVDPAKTFSQDPNCPK